MKKRILLGLAAIVMLALAGCPGDEGPSEQKQDDKRLPSGWSGLELLVLTGSNPGEISYTFFATFPQADSYKVWYIAGSKTKAEEIVEATGAEYRDHTDPASNRTIDNLNPGSNYSIVVVAVKGDEKGYSAVRSAKAASTSSDNAFVLTVSGVIPNDIVGAAVLENLSTGTVLAVARKSAGTFKFYIPDFTIPAIPMPSQTPWEGDGSYPLVLSTITAQRYLYTAGKDFSDPTAFATTFDFTGRNGTANWSDFKQLLP